MLSHLSDLEIAKQSTLRPISEIAEKVGISHEALEPYGHYKGKVDITKLNDLEEKGKSCTCNSFKSNASW